MSVDRIVSAVVTTTGEVLEYHVKTPGEVTRAFNDVEAHIAAYRVIKTSLIATGMDLLSKQSKPEVGQSG